MRYVLDTNVVSALRVRGRSPAVEQWAASVPVIDQFVTALTISEIERGVIPKERADPVQGHVLRRWFEEGVLPAFTGRVLPLDVAAARTLAAYRVTEHAPLDDVLIGPVAQTAELTVAIRNTRYFDPLGVSCIDPWTENS